MKRTFLLLLAGVSTLVLASWASPRAMAHDDEGNQSEIRISAPLEAVDCASQTVTVLGLTIDIHAARLSGGECDDDDDQGDDDQGDDLAADHDDDDDDQGECALTCADLVTGESVQVRLTTDAVPLTATEVRLPDGDDDDDEDLVSGDSESEIEMEAPLQAVDPIAHTIQVLGLTVDISGAEIGGDDDCDDEGDDGGDDDLAADHDCNEPTDASDLLVGQFVEVELASSLPPFSATEVEVQHSGNDVEVEVHDHDGHDIDDTDELTVDIKTKVKVAKRTAEAGSHTRTVTRVLHVRGAVAGGRFVLSGLPSGPAKITITRTTAEGLSTGKAKVNVKTGVAVPAVVRLKSPRTS